MKPEQIREQPILTTVFDELALFSPQQNSSYIFGFSTEERSSLAHDLRSRTSRVKFLEIIEKNSNSIVLKDPSGKETEIRLRSKNDLSRFWRIAGKTLSYLDITGLSHHVWAPLLKRGLEENCEINAVYIEPLDYKFSPTPTEGEIFDLSEKISGVSPIPGFLSLRKGTESKISFIPLLGFEGKRLAYLIEQVQPHGKKIIPIIGVPGFRPEYPFYAYQGNKNILMENRAWKNVRYSTANCPFGLYYTLLDISKNQPDDLLKIAPIGTKPHSLGAILFSIGNPHNVEIVYDHPIRKEKRTKSHSRLLVYHVSKFMGDLEWMHTSLPRI